MSDSCDGACCAVFTLKTPIEKHYNAYIVDMAIPLTDAEAAERRAKFDFEPWTADTTENERKPFTCRHWDETTRLCTAYEDRPVMCRDYPYYGECTAPNCSFCPTQDVIAKWVGFRHDDALKKFTIEPRRVTK